MGYYISGMNGNLGENFNIITWHSIYGLATIFGWEPKGTVTQCWVDKETGERTPLPCCDPNNTREGEWIEDDEWSGFYFTNDYQEITADDAKNLAEALERMLEYISSNKLGAKGIVEESNKGDYDEIEAAYDMADLISPWVEENGQKKIKDCIELFKSGTCYIT
jgi:hypothetical protein